MNKVSNPYRHLAVGAPEFRPGILDDGLIDDLQSPNYRELAIYENGPPTLEQVGIARSLLEAGEHLVLERKRGIGRFGIWLSADPVEAVVNNIPADIVNGDRMF